MQRNHASYLNGTQARLTFNTAKSKEPLSVRLVTSPFIAVDPSDMVAGNGHGGLAAGDTTNGISEVDQQVASRLVGIGGFPSLFYRVRFRLLGLPKALHRRLPAGPACRLQS